MSGYEPKVGDRVRYVVEGTLVEHISDPPDWHYLTSNLGPTAAVHASHIVSVEKVEPPKPPLPTTPGSVIRRVLPDGDTVHRLLMRDGAWVSDTGLGVEPEKVHPGYEVIFDAGAKS